MSQRRFFERLDDWMNPIVVKELRQAVQSRLVVSALMVFLVIQVFVLGTNLLSTQARGQGQIDYRAGRSLFIVLQIIMFGTCLLVPIYVGGRLGSERSDSHSDLMFISTLKPRSIVAGKLLSGMILVLLIFSACTPFMTFTYLLRGIDIPSILFLVAMDFMFSLVAMACVIFVAVIPAPRPVRIILSVGVFVALLYLFGGGWALTIGLLELGFDMGSWTFWGWTLLAGAVIIGQSALFFCWSTAMLSPPSANKAVLSRLVMLAYILLLGVPCYLVSAAINSYMPLAVWVIISAVLGSVQLFISVNERERLGPRVKRTIPHSPLLRPLAFLFYSGAAGGVLFSSLLLLGTIVTGVLILHLRGDLDQLGYNLYAGPAFIGGWVGSGWGGAWQMVVFLRFSVLLALYTYCYCLTAVFVRSVLLRSQVKPSFTWLVALLLVSLGSVGPLLVVYFVAPDRVYRGSSDYDYSRLTDPFSSIGQAMDYRRGFGTALFDMYCMPFLVVWATLISLANLPWLAGQVKRFTPLRQMERAEKEPKRVRADSRATV